jgi:hypothetical protein
MRRGAVDEAHRSAAPGERVDDGQPVREVTVKRVVARHVRGKAAAAVGTGDD